MVRQDPNKADEYTNDGRELVVGKGGDGRYFCVVVVTEDVTAGFLTCACSGLDQGDEDDTEKDEEDEETASESPWPPSAATGQTATQGLVELHARGIGREEVLKRGSVTVVGIFGRPKPPGINKIEP